MTGCKILIKGVKTDSDIERYEGGSDTMAFWTLFARPVIIDATTTASPSNSMYLVINFPPQNYM